MTRVLISFCLLLHMVIAFPQPDTTEDYLSTLNPADSKDDLTELAGTTSTDAILTGDYSDLEADVSVEDGERLQGLEGELVSEDEDVEYEEEYADPDDYDLTAQRSATITFNDSNVNTISALGNIGLVIGGLYLLSGFSGGPSKLAKSDPLGLKRQFPSRPVPNFITHKKGEKHHDKPKSKPKKNKKPDTKMSRHKKLEHKKPHMHMLRHRQGLPAMQAPVPPVREVQPVKNRRLVRPTTVSVAKERQLLRPVRPRFPTVPPLRLRMPSLPSLPTLPSLPALPNIRRPTLPTLNNPFRRPPVNPVTPVFRPAVAPAVADRPTSGRVRPRPAPEDSSFRDQSAPILPEPITFNSPFEADPFSEFRTANFGDAASFRELLDEQFGDFTFEKIKRKSD